MKAIAGVDKAVVTNVNDPLLRGRVQVQLPYAGVPEEWAQVVITPASGIQPRFAVGDQVLVAFEEGNVQLPYVLGKLWNGAPVPQVAGVPQVHLPTGSTLQPVVESANASQQCGMTADLERQVAPWLASAECLLKILALLKPLIDVIEQLPNPNPSAIQAFGNAAVALQPCLQMGTATAALPLVRDLLCLSLRSLYCLRDSPLPPSQMQQAARGIQGVLDLGQPFFAIAGVAAVQLSVVNDPTALNADIQALQAETDVLGGCPS